MASDSGFMSESDCDDGYSTKVSDCQLIYLKEKLAKSILDSENMSAEVQHFPGRSAKLNISFGARTNSQSHTGNRGYNSLPEKKTSNHLLVKNLPELADEGYLQMFFEYTKGQGGGLVKKITLNKADKIAIIEFEETCAVDIVLKKRPIQMLGHIVAAEKCVPILGADETLELIQISGLPEKFVENVRSMSQSELRQYESVSFQLVPKTDAHFGIRCEGCGMSPIRGIRYACERLLNLKYNYCENCKLKMNPQQTHKFRKLEVGRYPQDFYHGSDWCKYCFKTITGSKFRCIKCRDFDMCPVCKDEKPHDPDHPWVKF